MIDLVRDVVERVDVSQEQAEGSVGLLLRVAQQRLAPEEFAVVANAIPGISDVILKAPEAQPIPRRSVRAFWQGVKNYLSGPGALASVTDGFHQLGLPRRMIQPIAETVLSHCLTLGAHDSADWLRRAWRIRTASPISPRIDRGHSG